MYPGQAQAGDLMRDPYGQLVEVVSVTCANALIEGMSERDRLLDAPNYHSAISITATCSLSGDTTGREKRDHERWRAGKQRVLLGGRNR